MAKNYYGSICLTDLIDKAKAKHEAFSRSEKNQKVYVKVSVWISDTPDQYGNSASIQVNAKERENRFYIGNLKESQHNTATVQDVTDILDLVTEDDLFF